MHIQIYFDTKVHVNHVIFSSFQAVISVTSFDEIWNHTRIMCSTQEVSHFFYFALIIWHNRNEVMHEKKRRHADGIALVMTYRLALDRYCMNVCFESDR